MSEIVRDKAGLSPQIAYFRYLTSDRKLHTYALTFEWASVASVRVKSLWVLPSNIKLKQKVS